MVPSRSTVNPQALVKPSHPLPVQVFAQVESVQLVHVPPLSGMDQFAAGSRFECLFPCLFLASRFEAAVSVFSVENEFLSLYNFGHEPGIHLDARFNCLLITARPEIAALVGYFYWLPVRK